MRFRRHEPRDPVWTRSIKWVMEFIRGGCWGLMHDWGQGGFYWEWHPDWKSVKRALDHNRDAAMEKK